MEDKLSLQFENFIDVAEHNEQIDRIAKKIRNEYAAVVDAGQYLHALFDFFVEDIKPSPMKFMEKLSSKKAKVVFNFYL